MSKKGAFHFTGLQKAIIWIVALLCVWKIIQVPAVWDSVMQFLGDGEVPITHKTLSPAGMVWAASGVAVLVIALILHKELARLVRFIRHRPSTPVEIVPVTEMPVIEETPADEPAAVTPSIAAPVWPIVIKQPRKRHLPTLSPHTKQTLIRAGKRSGVTLAHAAIIGTAWTGAAVHTLAILTGRVLYRAWRHAEPRLRRFDHWLEIRVKRVLKHQSIAPWVELIRDFAHVMGVSSRKE
jgi:hypothetical protein